MIENIGGSGLSIVSAIAEQSTQPGEIKRSVLIGKKAPCLTARPRGGGRDGRRHRKASGLKT